MGRPDRSKRKGRGRGGLDWHDDELEGFERMGAWVSTLGGQAFNKLLTGKKYRALARKRKLEAEAAAAAAAAQSQRQSLWQTAGACLGPAVNTVQQLASGASSGGGVYEAVPQQDQQDQQQHGQNVGGGGGGGGGKGSVQQQPGGGGRAWRDVWIEAQVWRHELARKCPVQATAAALIAALVVVLASAVFLRRCRRAKRGARGSTRSVFIGSGEQSTAEEQSSNGASGAEGRSKRGRPRLTPDDAAEDTQADTATTNGVTDGNGDDRGDGVGGGDVVCGQGPPIVDPNINYWPAERMSKYTNLLMSLSFLFPGGKQRNMKMVRFSMWQTEDHGNGAIKKAPFEAYEVMGYGGSDEDGDDDDEDKEEEGEGEEEGGVDAERKDEKDDRHADSSTPSVSSAASSTSSDAVAVSPHSNGADGHVKMESHKISNGNNSPGEAVIDSSGKDSDDNNDWRQHAQRDTSIA